MSCPIGLFYGSTTGNTESVAELISEQIGFDKIHRIDIAADGLDSLAEYEHLILGIPTWDFGELQEDWADMWTILEKAEPGYAINPSHPETIRCIQSDHPDQTPHRFYL